jgi:hypothetical protein
MKGEAKSIILAILVSGLVMLVGIGNINVHAQDAAKTDTTAGKTDKKQQTGLVTDWLNDFEASEDWRALSTCPLGDTKIRKTPGKPRPVNEKGDAVNEKGEAGDFPAEIQDENGIAHKNEFVLGVKTYYLERGFDRVEVFPPNEYIIRGKAKEIKVWALGRKFRHTLFVKLRDYRGNLYKLKVGRLDFWGWRELSVVVPGWLPQSASYAMLDKNLHFVSFFVESDQYEMPGTFYFYLDNLRVVTDLSEFTGDQSIKDTW